MRRSRWSLHLQEPVKALLNSQSSLAYSAICVSEEAPQLPPDLPYFLGWLAPVRSAVFAVLGAGWIWNCGSCASWCAGSSRCTGQPVLHFHWLLCNNMIGLPEDSKLKKIKNKKKPNSSVFICDIGVKDGGESSRGAWRRWTRVIGRSEEKSSGGICSQMC